MNNLGTIVPDSIRGLSMPEQEALYSQVDEIINYLDNEAVSELLSVTGTDYEQIMDILLDETNKVLNLKSYNESVNMLTLNGLPGLRDSYEEFLRKKSFLYFTSAVLPDFELAWHCVEWMSMVQIYRLLCLICSRDHSKSYTISFAQALWRLYRFDRPTQTFTPPLDVKFYREGMIITNEFKLAKKLLKKVKEEVRINPILNKALYPGTNGIWANESIQTIKGSEITLSSFRTSNRGPHPGWIVVDDFLDKSAMYSKEQRDKFKEVFFAEVMNMILPQGQVITVGTPFHTEDLYADLKKDPSWKVFEYPALFPDGAVLWPNRYDFDALVAKRYTLGSLIFSREILVRPVSDSSSIFPWSILERAYTGMNDYVLVRNRASFPVQMERVAIGADWAKSAEIGADNTWFIVLGKAYDGKLWLLYGEKLHGARYSTQIERLRALNLAFGADVIVSESNAFQQVMNEVAEDWGINNIQKEVTNNNTKKDVYEGLPAIAVYFEQGRYRFPRGDAKSREVTSEICSELNSIAFDSDTGKLESVSENDDSAMALYFATKGVMSIAGTFRVSTT